jgi:predicted aspartyl protease
MLVDTGADCTLIPATVAKALELPRVGSLEIVGVGGTERTAYVHAALVEFAGRRLLARVVPFDHEAILGRDLLNGIVIVMDGPKRVLQVRRKR